MQSLSQQTPSAQNPDAHWDAFAHAVPFGLPLPVVETSGAAPTSWGESAARSASASDASEVLLEPPQLVPSATAATKATIRRSICKVFFICAVCIMPVPLCKCFELED